MTFIGLTSECYFCYGREDLKEGRFQKEGCHISSVATLIVGGGGCITTVCRGKISPFFGTRVRHDERKGR